MMIELAAVHFAHDRGLDLLAEVDLAIAPGEVVAVAAPAGAGATTLMRLLLGELTARGRVAFAGRDVARLRSSSRAALRRRLGVVPQDLGLIGRDTALANVALALEVCGVSAVIRAMRARTLLAAVEVDADLVVDRLSMAARQRVAWARAMVRSPDAVLADQPTCHQDADGAEQFATLVAERAELGAACLILTRDPHLIAAGARRGWRMLALHRKTLVDVVPAMAEPVAAEASSPVRAVPSAVETEISDGVPLDIADEDIADEMTISTSGGTVDPAADEITGPVSLAARTAVSGELEARVLVPDIAPAASTLANATVDRADDDHDAIPNVVPFPLARSAGTRR